MVTARDLLKFLGLMPREPPHDFIPEHGATTTQSQSRFPGYIVVLEDPDLVKLLRQAERMGYRPNQIRQTEYDGSNPSGNGHILLCRGRETPQESEYGMITSELVDPASQTLVYRFYTPLEEIVQAIPTVPR